MRTTTPSSASRPTRAPEHADLCWSGGHPGAGLRAGVAARRRRPDRRGRPGRPAARAGRRAARRDRRTRASWTSTRTAVAARRSTAGRPTRPRLSPRAHLAHGTTSMTASLVTDSVDALADSVRDLADVVDDGVLTGIHLEGPWLSPKHAGAHDPALLVDPKPEQVEALLEAGRGHVRMVTLAPELPGGLDAVRRLNAAGVVAAIGHTDATYDVAVAALDAGASVGHAPVQRDARTAPPRTRTGRRAARAPRRVRRADRRRRARPPRGAAARGAGQATPDRARDRRDGRRGCGRRRLPARPAHRDRARRRGAAGRGRRHRRLDADHGRRGEVRRRRWSACRSRTPSAPPPPHRPRCSASTGSARCSPATCADVVVLDADLDVQRVLHRGQWVTSAG